MKEKLFALSLGFGALILVTQTQAQTQVQTLVQTQVAAAQCGPRALVMAQLADRFGETRRSMGIAANNMVMEMFASEASQSWTITVTTPQGQTCLVASGQGFEAMVEELPAKGEPA
jgi:arginine/lysine/ornithine decarboxylase